MYAIMVTGHRPNKVGGYSGDSSLSYKVKCEIIEYLVEQSEKHPDLCVLCGMAQGVDTWFAEAALDLDLSVLAYIPFQGQDDRWPRLARKHYKNLIKQCSYVYKEASFPSKEAFLERNIRMVEDCDEALAFWDGSPSGTGFTVRKLKEAGKLLTIFNPQDL